MKKFKDTNNKVHEIEEGFEHLLPSGTVEITEQEAAELLAPPPPTAEEYIQQVSGAVQNVLDAEAQSLGYDNIHTAVTYAAETAVAKFSTDGKSFRKWRSLVWAYCYAALEQFETDMAAYIIEMGTYQTDLDQYNLDHALYLDDLAQYEIDVILDDTLIAPTEPTSPATPTEVVAPTIDDIVSGMPARV